MKNALQHYSKRVADGSKIVQFMKSLPEHDQTALATSMIPGVGDVMGVRADARNMIDNPDQRTFLNAALMAAGAIPFIPSRSQAKAASNAVQGGIDAYHASPHNFDKFSMGSIGTGEGNQTYGHGLYFSENPDVTDEYYEEFSDGLGFLVDGAASGDLSRLEANAMEAASSGKLSEYIGGLENQLSKAKIKNAGGGRFRENLSVYEDAISFSKGLDGKVVTPAKATRYKVKIDASPDDLLDWDTPISEQSDNVKSAVGKYLDDFSGADKEKILGANPLGGDIYEIEPKINTMRKRGALAPFDWDEMYRLSPNIAESLLSKGIKGVRYKDGFSRGVKGGTSNYVVFDEDIISIAKKYGIPPVIVATMLGRANREDET